MPQDPFYNSPQWRAVRAEKLRFNPVCEALECGRRASYADHVQSLRSGRAPFDLGNTRSYCHGCYSRKTCAQDGGFGRTPGTPPAQRGCDVNGLPLNPGHRWRADKP